MGLGKTRLSYELAGGRNPAGPGLRTVARAHCFNCGAVEEIPWHPGQANNPEFVQKLFRNRGWEFDAFHKSGCVCPACLAKPKHHDVDELIKRRQPTAASATAMKDAAASGEVVGRARVGVVIQDRKMGILVVQITFDAKVASLFGPRLQAAGTVLEGLRLRGTQEVAIRGISRGVYTLLKNGGDTQSRRRVGLSDKFAGVPLDKPTEAVWVDLRRDGPGFRLDPLDLRALPNRTSFQKMVTMEKNQMTTQPPRTSPDNVVPIRDLTPKELKVVYRLLDEHFDEQLGLYSQGWSDRRVGEEANVPMANVQKVRRESYGELKSNSAEVEAFKAEAQGIMRLLEQAMDRQTALDLRIKKIEEEQR